MRKRPDRSLADGRNSVAMGNPSIAPHKPAYDPPGASRAFSRFLAHAAVALSVLLCVAVISGCSTTRGPIPYSLLSCAPQPPSPIGGDQRAAALYVLDLAMAGEDCRSKLGSVRRLSQ